jgi:two-component system phosphate regulon sensor histidine kinase PhoR
LTAILAFVETLEDGAINDAENGPRFLASVRRNAQRMQALIDDILELSFIESGNTSLDKRNINAANAIDGVFADLSAAAEAKNIKFINNISTDVSVYADPTRLDQMLTNLVDNAIKFNRKNGSIEVRITNRECRSLIEIIDTGEGISPEHIKRIFERFYRGDRSRAREISGTGLGLSIVKHLAKLHGGEVYVTSKLGSGTTFHIELPAS